MKTNHLALALLFSAAAFAQEVQYSYDQNADFKKLPIPTKPITVPI